MQTCFLFPGQGAQYLNMGVDLHEHSKEVQALFTMASDIAHFDVYDTLTNGSAADLQRTDRTQILITTVNLAARAVLESYGITSNAAAGFSLGEYAALVDAGVISVADAFTLVNERGNIMEEASRTLDSADGPAGMIAAIGMDYPEIQGLLEKHSVQEAYCSIYNSPVQTVISGTAKGLQAARDVLADKVRIVPLKVSGPFHCTLMKEAFVRFSEVLNTKIFTDPIKIVYSNVTGTSSPSGSELRKLCAEQLMTTVQWVVVEKQILADGYVNLYEVGPGKVLGGLWKAFAKHNQQAADIQVHEAGVIEAIKSLA